MTEINILFEKEYWKEVMDGSSNILLYIDSMKVIISIIAICKTKINNKGKKDANYNINNKLDRYNKQNEW